MSWYRSDEVLEVTDSFRLFYKPNWSCFDETSDRICSRWKDFHSLLQKSAIASDIASGIVSGIATKIRGHAYTTCVCNTFLFASETWVRKVEDINQIKRNDSMMIRWLCSAKLVEKIPMSELGLAKIGSAQH